MGPNGPLLPAPRVAIVSQQPAVSPNGNVLARFVAFRGRVSGVYGCAGES